MPRQSWESQMIDGVFPTSFKPSGIFKMTKPYRKYQVQYSDEGSAEEHCSLCEHYINKSECAIVQGKINPDGWCKKFKKK